MKKKKRRGGGGGGGGVSAEKEEGRTRRRGDGETERERTGERGRAHAPIGEGSLAVRKVEYPLAVEDVRVAQREDLLLLRHEAKAPHPERRGVLRPDVVHVNEVQRQPGDE